MVLYYRCILHAYKKFVKSLQNVCNNFERKTLDEYHYFYLKRDTLLLVDVFQNFRKIRNLSCLEML